MEFSGFTVSLCILLSTFTAFSNVHGLRCNVCFEVSAESGVKGMLDEVWQENIQILPCNSASEKLQNLGYYLSSLQESSAVAFKAAAARVPSTLYCSKMELTVPEDPETDLPHHVVSIYNFENTPIARENEADSSMCKESLDPQDFADMAVDLPPPGSLAMYSKVVYCICNGEDGCNSGL